MGHFNANTARLHRGISILYNPTTKQVTYEIPYRLQVRTTDANGNDQFQDLDQQSFPDSDVEQDLTSVFFAPPTGRGFCQLLAGIWDQTRTQIISQETLDVVPGQERVYLENGDLMVAI